MSELRQPGCEDRSIDDAPCQMPRTDLVFSESLSAVPGSVAALRAMVARFATQAGLAPSIIERVKLAVSEAATNVVVHAYRDASQLGSIHVEATFAKGELRVSVADTGSGLRPDCEGSGLGLGLGIIARLADSFEVLPGGSGGLRVLMRFAVPAGKSA